MQNYSHHLSVKHEILGTEVAVTFNDFLFYFKAQGPIRGQLVSSARS